MPVSIKFKRLDTTKFLLTLDKEVRKMTTLYGLNSRQERTAASRLWGAREMQRRYAKQQNKQQAVIAMLCQRISDWLHRGSNIDEDVLLGALASAIDAIPAAEAIMNWRDELDAANRKIKQLELDLAQAEELLRRCHYDPLQLSR
jgi:hypothetical protein